MVICFQETNLALLKTAILAKVAETRLKEIWLKLLNQMLEDLNRYRCIKTKQIHGIPWFIKRWQCLTWCDKPLSFLSRSLLAVFFLWQFTASSTGRPVECHCSGSPDKKPARCCSKEHAGDGFSHQRGHRHQGYHWWHWGLVGQTQAASRGGQGGEKEQRKHTMYLCN